jgi:hypothetical protein
MASNKRLLVVALPSIVINKWSSIPLMKVSSQEQSETAHTLPVRLLYASASSLSSSQTVIHTYIHTNPGAGTFHSGCLPLSR